MPATATHHSYEDERDTLICLLASLIVRRYQMPTMRLAENVRVAGLLNDAILKASKQP